MPGPGNPEDKKTSVLRLQSPEQRGLGRKDPVDMLRAQVGTDWGGQVVWMVWSFGEIWDRETFAVGITESGLQGKVSHMLMSTS